MAEVSIYNDIFTLDPIKVDTVRPELFNPGHFSIFDVLIHIDTQGMIQLCRIHLGASQVIISICLQMLGSSTPQIMSNFSGYTYK